MGDISSEQLLMFIQGREYEYRDIYEEAIAELAEEENDPDGSPFALNTAREEVTRWGSRLLELDAIKRYVEEQKKASQNQIDFAREQIRRDIR